MSTAVTFYFLDVIGNEVHFENYIRSIAPNYGSLLDSTFIKYLWRFISRHYGQQNIRYSDKNTFLVEFAFVLENILLKFKKQLEMINKIYTLTDDELIEVNTSLTNIANNPNTEPDDPLKPIKFVSSQSYSLLKSNKLNAYLNALNQIPYLLQNELMKGSGGNMGLNDLFMVAIPKQYYTYGE